MKFVFDGADVRKLERVLEQNLTPIAFGVGNVSQVSSIYFDDDMLSSCRESLAGVSRRTKVRLRWYDRSLPPGDAFFELKHRIGETVRKERTPMQLPGAALDYPRLMRLIHDALRPGDASWLHLRPRPVVMVCYRRRHFLDSRSGARVTLDFDITGYDQLGRQSVVRRFPVTLGGRAVIEAKMPAGSEAMVRQLLHPLRPRLTRSSKYVQCCGQLGWCRWADVDD